VKTWTAYILLGTGAIVGPCEHSKVSSGSIIFIELISDSQLLKKVSFHVDSNEMCSDYLPTSYYGYVGSNYQPEVGYRENFFDIFLSPYRLEAANSLQTGDKANNTCVLCCLRHILLYVQA